MADRKHLLHVKSNVAEKARQYGIDNFLVTPKKPVDPTTGKATDDTLLYGEIAVNYGKGVEALTIRNTDDDVVVFVNENDFYEAGEITAAALATEKKEREEAEFVTSNALTYLDNKIDTSTVSAMVSTTYAEIKELREQSKLKAGQLYRITDYATTTTQENTQSAGHVFDIIVLATDVDTLNENAKVVKHEGDTYFANSNLDAWEIKYDLDNDTTKYIWADTANGKGVIFYMKDEWNNECPYDFKNIMFNRTATAGNLDINGFYYTFSWVNEKNEVEDASIVGQTLTNDEGSVSGVHDNLISVGDAYNLGISRNTFAIALNGNVFVAEYSYDTGIFYGIYGNHLATNCYNNTFGNKCCYNTFGNECSSNTFGNWCSNNTFGNECSSNTFGNECTDNTFGNWCYRNTFGNECMSNTFGNYCDHNMFGNRCRSNTFGNSVTYITFEKDYTCKNIVENGNTYITVTSLKVTSSTLPLQNFTIAQGVNNATDESGRKTIHHTATADAMFKTTYQNPNSKTVNV